jgi:general secretion pathway protein M
MMSRLTAWYAALRERERRFVLIGAVACVLILLILVVLPVQRAAATAKQRVERKRADLAWVTAMAPQLATLQTAVPTSNESLVVLVDRAAREAGLSKALSGSQPSGDGGLSVRMENASFDTLMAWLAQLRERYGVRAQYATIETTNAPGAVNATFVLHSR